MSNINAEITTVLCIPYLSMPYHFLPILYINFPSSLKPGTTNCHATPVLIASPTLDQLVHHGLSSICRCLFLLPRACCPGMTLVMPLPYRGG
jgi:hypothetical protein